MTLRSPARPLRVRCISVPPSPLQFNFKLCPYISTPFDHFLSLASPTSSPPASTMDLPGELLTLVGPSLLSLSIRSAGESSDARPEVG